MSPGEKIRRNPSTAFRPVADEGGLVVIPKRSEVKVLNPVGSRIYELLDGTHSREEILTILVDEFDVTREAAGADFDGFMADLREAEMLDEAGMNAEGGAR